MAWDTVTTADDTGIDEPFSRSNRTGRLSGSPQQLTFWDALLHESDHILLDARAGTGKSSSMREGMHRLRESFGPLRVSYCCFNKAIADEFRSGCPSGVDVGTMHSFGFRTLSNAFGSNLDNNKTYLILDSMNGPSQRYLRSSIARLVSVFKSQDPEMRPSWANLETLAMFHDVNLWNQDGKIFEWAAKVIQKSDDMTSIIDYDDMLRLPVVTEIGFPTVDFLFIDEAQDLSSIQHKMAEMMSGSGRTIVAGDPMQAIYAFRGADPDSINILRNRLDASVYPLTVTRRCPKSHVELARQLVPDFEAAPDAPDGILKYGGPDMLERAGPGDMVLCRMNAPLIARCLRVVASRRKATVRGRAIGESLQAVVRRLGEPSTIADFCRELGRWKAREIMRLEAKDGSEPLIEKVTDRADCLEAVASSCGSPAEVPDVIRELFSEGDTSDRITFSSVHRGKGSESTNVYLIDIPYSAARDRKKPPQDWELGQRRNVAYVSYTRSRNYLGIIQPERSEL